MAARLLSGGAGSWRGIVLRFRGVWAALWLYSGWALAGGGAAGWSVSGPLPPKSDADFEDARRLVVAHVLGEGTSGVQLSAATRPIVAAETPLTTWGGREVAAPWGEYWLFFVDDDPRANWAHPCRYVFVARDLSAIAVQHATTPPNLGMEVLIRYEPPSSGAQREAPRDGRGPPRLAQGGSASNCYAVIVSGGYDVLYNASRYWGDVAAVYSTLTLTYGYPKANVFAYVSDGTNPEVDGVDLRSGDYFNSPTDLDGDGVPDTIGEASAANVSNAFVHLQSVLGPGDQLFVYLTDHGNRPAGGGAWDAELNLWNQEILRDVDLAALTADLPCPVLFAMQQCYSGGFVDNLTQPRRAVATAAAHDGTSSGGDTFWDYDQWTYEWVGAMRGFYPSTNAPWENGEPCDADFNGDGLVSFREAAFHAHVRAPVGDLPAYADSPAHFGSRMFLVPPTSSVPSRTDWVELEPFRTPPVAHEPFAARVVARDAQGRVAPDFAGPVALEAVADVVNPGLTVGTPAAAFSFLMRTEYRTVRTQTIFPAARMGGAKDIDQISLHVVAHPTQTLNRFTIRLRHTEMEQYPLPPEPVAWETDWTTVVQENRDVVSNGWVTFAFTNAFAYDGVRSLMADFSFSNEFATSSSSLTVSYDGVTLHRTLHRAVDGEFGDPLLWAGTNPPASRTYLYPHVHFGPLPYRPQVEVAPSLLTNFADGVWTGELAVWSVADNVRILVATTNAYWDTETPRFAVRDYDFGMALPQHSGDGSFVLNWGSGSGYAYGVWWSSNLLGGFVPLATNLPATPPLNTYTGAVGSTPYGFFRVKEE